MAFSYIDIPGSFGLVAHAAPISYRFPLPIWIYVLGGGAAVLASAPAAALAVRQGTGRGRRSRDLYPVLRRLRLGAIGLTLVSLLFAWALVGGFGSRSAQGQEFFENPATVLIWVDFWVLLGLVSTLVGNVWDFVSPLNAAARLIDRVLARLEVEPLPYPAWLGQWPALALLLVWSWAELIWAPAKNPHTLALIAASYFMAQLSAAGLFGAEVWLANGELFTAFARAFARFAPLELTPASPDEWLAAPPGSRQVRLRPYGVGLRSEPPLPAGGGGFVLAVLATVVYDGFSRTNRYALFESWFLQRWSWLGLHVSVLDTALMFGIILLFVLAFLAVAALLGSRESGATGSIRRYAPTLIPIAAVYFVAHYFAYLLFAGQQTLAVLVDPLGKGWNPAGLGEYGIWKGIAPAVVVWWAQIALIVWGHVAGIVAAHRVALGGKPRPQRVLLAQAPLVALMVGYTMAGLWVLAQQIRAAGTG